MPVLAIAGVLAAAYVLAPLRMSHSHSTALRSGVVVSQSIYANDGGDSEVDWDKEAAKLALPQNEYYKEIKRIPVPELVKEFADSAPPDVQDAVRITIAKLLGNMPTEVAAITRVTTNQNIASLMFSMQMTGYVRCGPTPSAARVAAHSRLRRSADVSQCPVPKVAARLARERRGPRPEGAAGTAERERQDRRGDRAGDEGGGGRDGSQP
jgi:hypothetical protein